MNTIALRSRLPNENPMKSDFLDLNARTRTWAWLVLALLALMLAAPGAGAATGAQKTFATPEDAAAALAQALKIDDTRSINAVLGTAGSSIESGDPVADKAAVAGFVASYDAKHAIVHDGDAAKLTIGTDGFPFAFPLVKSGDRWRFDTKAGMEELLARRIGANELYAINVVRAIVDAQLEYASTDRNGDGVLDYARKFASSKGKHDGLYWPTTAGEPPSPLGALVARASGEGYPANKPAPTPYHGYIYRLLSGQGKNAAGGALDYVVKGRAIAGFAVVAYPAKYANSGIMTFIVNQDGKVFQSDLGRDTVAKATAMKRFDPGPGWSPANQ
jgi:hypothetical protein